MSRKFERILIYIASIWQIVTGSITAGVYLLNIEQTLVASTAESTIGMFIFLMGCSILQLALLI